MLLSPGDVGRVIKNGMKMELAVRRAVELALDESSVGTIRLFVDTINGRGSENPSFLTIRIKVRIERK